MSFSTFKDFDKSTRDLLSDDFKPENVLKVKSEGPHDISLTTKTVYDPSASSLPSTATFKWAHPSGFAVDKLEIASSEKLTLETSLKGVAPGLKLEFKGKDVNTANLGFVYNHKLATVTSEFDVVGYQTLKTGVLGGANGFLVGASADFNFGDKAQVKDYSVSMGYNPSCCVFAGVSASKRLSEINTALQYKINPKLRVAALVDYVPKDGSHKFTVGGTYGCCQDTIVKMKLDNNGVLGASVKQQLPKKLSVVVAAQTDLKQMNMNGFKFGVTATLG